MSEDFTHFDETGRARMVNVGEKNITHRTASAAGRVLVNPNTFELIRTGGIKIPMCHPVQTEGVNLNLWLDEERYYVEISAEVHCERKTGVEMEALTAVSVAALTVYDMCKAVQRDIVISDIRLINKSGGIHGDYLRKED